MANIIRNQWRNNPLGHDSNRISRLGVAMFEYEIDESLICHLNNGAQAWVVGIYDRASESARLFAVENRNAETLEEIVLGHIRRRTPINPARIYTDGWRGYNFIQNVRGFRNSPKEGKNNVWWVWQRKLHNKSYRKYMVNNKGRFT